jgi:hypothetical protein
MGVTFWIALVLGKNIYKTWKFVNHKIWFYLHAMTMYIGYGYLCNYRHHYLSLTLHYICTLQIGKEKLYYAEANIILIQTTEIFKTMFIKMNKLLIIVQNCKVYFGLYPSSGIYAQNKPYSSVQHTPSSESFKDYLLIITHSLQSY